MHHDPPSLFILLVVLPAAALMLYLLALRHESNWPRHRIIAFATGITLLMLAGTPRIADWAHHDLRGHMIQHLLLGMFAPLGLVLGAPGTLLLRRLPVRAARRVAAFFGTIPLRILTHPLTAALLDIGGMFVLYLTPLFAISMQDPVLHILLHVHFVLAGYLFTWSIAGPDPAPHRPGLKMRMLVLFLATAAHGILSKIMYGYGFPHGTHAPLAQVEAAALWMYYGGDLAEALLAAMLLVIWLRRRGDIATMRPVAA
ncbi:cytochrome c oxidase assembly protein [Falsirhodobacter deserti]|uniref:cytochrome c oxidase assembly protein n=1 Tax=Falsirhodobacter deserti TaxID=1365611 RepID=UPI000FE2F2BB|nr:cytochrome c oxidase assembly protein [Falsirhodobacter deserti]